MQQEVKIKLSHNLDLPELAKTDNDMAFDFFCNHIAYLLEYRLEYLMNCLYRLDVAEEKTHAALSLEIDAPANVTIANLILKRIEQQIHTKNTINVPPPIEEEDKW